MTHVVCVPGISKLRKSVKRECPVIRRGHYVLKNQTHLSHTLYELELDDRKERHI